MNSLIIINTTQYGYHTDTYKYTQLLKNYDIKYICFDLGKKKYDSKNVEVIYVDRPGGKVLNAIQYFYRIFEELKKYDRNTQVFVVNLEFGFIIPFFNSNLQYILDFRTLAVTGGSLKRYCNNLLSWINTLFYKHFTVIHPKIGFKMGLKNFEVIPLGADVIFDKKNLYDDGLRLIYLGTFNNREIDKAIKGFCLFLEREMAPMDKCVFHLAGYGEKKEMELISKTIAKYDRFGKVKFHGFKAHDELVELFRECNLGVSYVPMKEYFMDQPPTKTFEYLCSGLPVIATKTRAHLDIINNKNGILTADNETAFRDGLKDIHSLMNTFRIDSIKKSASQYTWKNICNNKLAEYLKQISCNNT